MKAFLEAAIPFLFVKTFRPQEESPLVSTGKERPVGKVFSPGALFSAFQ